MASQIRRGAVLSYATVAFNALTGLLYTPWMVSVIGNDYYGLYTLATSVINIFVMDFGLGDAVSRFLSKYYAEGDEQSANEFLGMVLRLYFGIAALLFVVLLVVYLNADAIYARLSAGQLIVFKRLFIVAALYSVVSFPLASLNGMLEANELFVKLNGCNLARRVLTVGLIVVSLVMGAGVYALVVINAAVGLVFGAVKIAIVRRDTGISPAFTRCGELRIREVLGFSAWTMVVQIAQRFIFALMPSIIAMVSNSKEIAVFGLASSLESYVWTVANALNGMFMPKVTRVLHGDSPEENIQALAVRVGRIQLLITGAIIVVFAAIGHDFITCWVGPEYDTLWLATLLLILPELVELPTMIEGTALVAVGRVKERGLAYIVMAATNLVLGYALSGPFGAVGACLAICVAYFVRTMGMCVFYDRFLGFKLSSFARDTYADWFVPAAMTVVAGLVLSHVLPLAGWSRFVVEAIVEATVYCASCWILTLDASNKERVARLFSNMMPIGRRRGAIDGPEV